jgi:hypothetical protein
MVAAPRGRRGPESLSAIDLQLQTIEVYYEVDPLIPIRKHRVGTPLTGYANARFAPADRLDCLHSGVQETARAARCIPRSVCHFVEMKNPDLPSNLQSKQLILAGNGQPTLNAWQASQPAALARTLPRVKMEARSPARA